MPHTTFARPDLTTVCRLDPSTSSASRWSGNRSGRLVPPTPCWRVELEPDGWRRRFGCEGLPRDTVARRLSHERLGGWRPTTLQVTLRRYRCSRFGHVWRQDTIRAAEPRAKMPRSRALCEVHSQDHAMTAPTSSKTRRNDNHATPVTPLSGTQLRR